MGDVIQKTRAKENVGIAIVIVGALTALIGIFTLRIFIFPMVKGTYDNVVVVFPIFILSCGICLITMLLFWMYGSKVLDWEDRIAISFMLITILIIAFGLFLYAIRVM